MSSLVVGASAQRILAPAPPPLPSCQLQLSHLGHLAHRPPPSPPTPPSPPPSHVSLFATTFPRPTTARGFVHASAPAMPAGKSKHHMSARKGEINHLVGRRGGGGGRQWGKPEKRKEKCGGQRPVQLNGEFIWHRGPLFVRPKHATN